MTHALTITLGDAADLAWAQRTVTAMHYLRSPVDPRARPMETQSSTRPLGSPSARTGPHG